MGSRQVRLTGTAFKAMAEHEILLGPISKRAFINDNKRKCKNKLENTTLINRNYSFVVDDNLP